MGSKTANCGIIGTFSAAEEGGLRPLYEILHKILKTSFGVGRSCGGGRTGSGFELA